MTDWGGSPFDRVKYLEGRVAEQRAETVRWQARAEAAEAELVRRGLVVPAPPDVPPPLPDPVVPDLAPTRREYVVAVIAIAVGIVAGLVLMGWLLW